MTVEIRVTPSPLEAGDAAVVNRGGNPAAVVLGTAAEADLTDFAAVATSGDYDDLINTPALDFAPATPTVGTSLGTTGTVDLDMAALNGTIQTISLTGNLTLTTSNRAAGRSVQLVITEPGTSSRTLTVPSGWRILGSARPTTLNNQTVVVSIQFTSNTDASALVGFSLVAQVVP
jgi:hypothetical protein